MSDSQPKEAYRVLARKYRPTTFEELIGQDAMVRTLSNAIKSGRLAQAFMLTGVRGVGKTTTARLVARALNCIGEDGQGSETITPCGVCEHCKAIAQDRHVDVTEMDAASRTGVDDIREVIDSVRYRPTSARYKIYIIDEVHMLSKGAFNALLKTLEEPPEHVKFIFATTEIRKVPVTVLSRCQRFDLRRIDQAMLMDHFKAICGKEDAKIEEPALAMIARAADGSVRDGLSLLDQAIAHGQGTVSEDQVRTMLGLADRARTFDLFDFVMKGDCPSALGLLDELYKAGADPTVVLQDLLELSHWLTRLKVVRDAAQNQALSETERVRGTEMAENLSISVLSRAYQMILKGLGEVRDAPHPQQACEMILIRLCHVAPLPSPEELVRQIKEQGGTSSVTGPASASSAPPGGGAQAHAVGQSFGHRQQMAPAAQPKAALRLVSDSQPQTHSTPQTTLKANPQSFEEVVELAEKAKEMILKANLMNNVHLVHFEPGKIEFRPADMAPKSLAGDLKKFLDRHTSRKWGVSLSKNAPGALTMAQVRDEQKAQRRKEVSKHPLVAQILSTFPGSEVTDVHEIKLEPITDNIIAAPDTEDTFKEEE